jgi:uncharacterized protein
MKTLNKIITITVLLFALCFQKNIQAQDSTLLNKNYIGLIGKYSSKSIVIRWAPSSSEAFFMLNKYGYKLEKAQIGKDTVYFKAVWKTVGIFKPADSMVWAKRVDTSNSYQVIAAHCVLGKIYSNLPTKPNFGEIMNRLNEERNLHGFAMVAADFDSTAANLLGVRFEDFDVSPNATYGYRITPLVPTKTLKILGSETFVQAKEEAKIPPPELIENGFEKHVRLDWYNNLHKNYYTAYYLERGDKKGKNFKRLNKVPFTLANDPKNPRVNDQMTYLDSVPQDYIVYSYRLIGINAFGELSDPGKIVYSYGRDRTAPEAAYNVNFADINGQYLNISWKKEKLEKDFIGYNVLRSQNYKGPFQIINDKILDKKTKNFIDTKPIAQEGSFYKIETIDTAGNINWSPGVYAFLNDSIPPAKPTGLSGKADSNGVITLRWNLGKETDIKGYRVFFANQLDHEMTILTGDIWQDTVFTDSVNINTLTKEIYYQIVASDMHYNHSVRSEIIKVVLPDTIRPVKPMFKNILVTDTAVYLSWIPSSSKDVIKHQLYRKKGQGQFTLWKSIEGKAKSALVDQDVKIGEVYAYRIEAIDDFNNKSGFPAEVSGKIYDVGKRKAVDNFKAIYNKDKKRTILTWTYPPSNKYHFAIYRSYNESTFRVYKSVDGTNTIFEDYDLIGNGTYTYAIVAYYKDGGSSGMSERSTIVIK